MLIFRYHYIFIIITKGGGKRYLLAPFWYRMYRCSDSDIEQLNFFHTYHQSMIEEQESESYLDYSYGIATNVGGNELYSYAGENALTYNDQVILTKRVLSSGYDYSLISTLSTI